MHWQQVPNEVMSYPDPSHGQQYQMQSHPQEQAYMQGLEQTQSLGQGMPHGMMGFVPTQSQQLEKPKKRVPDWLSQTLKAQGAMAEKQKKKAGVSLSTTIGPSPSSTVSGGISGYNLVHSPSPSPPSSPIGQELESQDSTAIGPGVMSLKKGPSWRSTEDSDSDDQDIRTKQLESATVPEGVRDGNQVSSGENGAGGREEEEHNLREVVQPVMDVQSQAVFDREVRRELTGALKDVTAAMIHEVASLVLQEVMTADPIQDRQKKKATRKQKEAIGALIGGYGSESESASGKDSGSQSDDSAKSGLSPAPAATTEEPAHQRGKNNSEEQSTDGNSLMAAQIETPYMLGGKWPLPTWADRPQSKILPSTANIQVETLGPDLKIIRSYKLVHTCTLLGRSEDQCEFVIEDSSASRCHAALLVDNSEGVHVVDLYSQNGTAVDGVTVRPGVLKPILSGTVLSLGTRNQSFRVVGCRRSESTNEESENGVRQDLVKLAAVIAARINSTEQREEPQSQEQQPEVPAEKGDLSEKRVNKENTKSRSRSISGNRSHRRQSRSRRSRSRSRSRGRRSRSRSRSRSSSSQSRSRSRGHRSRSRSRKRNRSRSRNRNRSRSRSTRRPHSRRSSKDRRGFKNGDKREGKRLGKQRDYRYSRSKSPKRSRDNGKGVGRERRDRR
ncbi:unnamed protein product [Choristocarpus tenellus]